MQRQLPNFLVRATFTSVVILSMSACSSDEINLPVRSAKKASADRFLDDMAAVAYASSASDKDHSDDNAYVVFIKKSGKTSVLKTGAHDNGTIATNRHGRVSWLGRNNRYVLVGQEQQVCPGWAQRTEA